MPDLEQAALAICDHIDALQRPRIAVVIDENDPPADGYQQH
jgi:hypothetical protein